MPTKKTPKKVPAKKSHTKAKVVKKSKVSGLSRHVGLRPDDQPFYTFQITKQTLYWLVIGGIVITYTIWLLRIQMDIQSIYDQIEATMALV